MPFAVHLFIEKETEQQITNVWQTLATSDKKFTDSCISTTASSGETHFLIICQIVGCPTVRWLGVTPEKKLKAVELVHQCPLPLHRQITQVGLIEFRPVKHLVQFTLGNGL